MRHLASRVGELLVKPLGNIVTSIFRSPTVLVNAWLPACLPAGLPLTFA